jgi:FtsZ-binding cell division protein ZapB
MEIEQKKYSNSGLKAAIVVLLLSLIGSGAYIFKMNTDNKETVQELITEKETIENDLKAKILEYDTLISEDNALKAEFEAQKEEMVALLANLEKSKGDVAAMSKYKNEYFRLKREMDNLVAENKLLKEQNIALTSSLDSTNVVLINSKVFNDTLVSQNGNLAKKVEKASILSVLNLNVVAVREKGSGKQIATDKASRADILNVNFIIAENQVAKSGDRTYYVQIIDSKNNVLGDKETIAIGDSKTLTYSFEKVVSFNNATVKVSEELRGKDFQAGNYFVNVFNSKGESVSNTSFNLR